MKTRTLAHAYHYTCDHGAAGIRRDGLIKPNPYHILPVRLAWFTDLEVPLKEPLGLTSNFVSCDRTVHRFEVDPTHLIWWPIYARAVPKAARWGLESATGAMPAHWWVSEHEVPVLPQVVMP